MSIQETGGDFANTGGLRVSQGALLATFTGTIFLSAFLLFSVQPMFAKIVLPTLGGSPGVWSVAMVFFQAVLLAGYLYAHCITKYLPLRGALAVHAVILAAAFIVLPLALPSGWEAAPESGQAFWLIGLFAVAVGLPFFAVSANSPLLQAWFARTGHAQAHDPYFLYGASNIGSFASLWLYAGLFEPTLAVPTQTLAWMLGYGALALLILACGLLAVGRSTATVEQVAEKAAPVDGITRVKWIGLAAIPSGLLVAVTAHVSTDIASAPFLWIVPLSLFLLSFVVAFARKPLIEGQMLSLLTFGFGVAAFFASRSGGGGLQWPLLAATMVFFFLAATLCHSKLAALKPAARHLTSFYLWMSFGGVVGGVVTTFGAPALFNTVAEFPLLIVAVLLLRGHHTSPFVRRIEQGALVLLMVWIAGAATIGFGSNELIAKRSFYGTVRVNMMEDQRYVAMQHGTTLHGAMRAEDLAEGTTPKPLTYYHETGGIAQALFARQQIVGDRLAHMGVIGLGTGSLLCHRKPNELWTNYEIDRDVVELASDPRYFRFVSACGQGDPIEVADGRLGVARHKGANFDYLLVDAFSSNSVPPHLLTREAMAVYMDKMAEDGIVVMHISNRFMELRSVVAALAQDAGLAMRVGIFPRPADDPDAKVINASEVVVLARKDAYFGPMLQDPRWEKPAVSQTEVWTDDYSNILGAIWRKLNP